MSNPYLTKIAEIFTQERKKDLLNTGVIAGLGGVGSMVTGKLLGVKNAFSPKAFAIGTGVGLAADYAGLQLNKRINKYVDGVHGVNQGAVSAPSNKASLL